MKEASEICGLFGFAGPDAPRQEALLDVAEKAATRGPHSHGFVASNRHNLLVHRDWGDMRESLHYIEQLAVPAIIGHSRLATTGTYAGGPTDDLDATMPFIAGDTAIVHNGNVRDFEALAKRFRITLESGCDSEIIAHLLFDLKGESVGSLPLATLLMMVIDKIDDGSPFAIIAMNLEGEMAAARRDLPLYVATCREGVYLCSREPEIEDAQIIKLPENSSWGFPTTMIRNVKEEV